MCEGSLAVAAAADCLQLEHLGTQQLAFTGAHVRMCTRTQGRPPVPDIIKAVPQYRGCPQAAKLLLTRTLADKQQEQTSSAKGMSSNMLRKGCR
jgi:hypothetical protein